MKCNTIAILLVLATFAWGCTTARLIGEVASDAAVDAPSAEPDGAVGDAATGPDLGCTDSCPPKLVAGGSYTCLLRDGEVKCWGKILSSEADYLASPYPIEFSTSVVDVAPGAEHACALLRDGTVWCWGSNAGGQIGSAGASATPQQVELGGQATALGAGLAHSCAEVGDSVYCWGDNTSTQSARACDADRCDTPTAVLGFSDATHLSLGSDHSCVIGASGNVFCWGAGDQGQLGTAGSGETAIDAAQVIGLSDIVEIASGAFFSCARNLRGNVRCWGQNIYQQLGRDVFSKFSGVPQEVENAPEAISIAVGTEHSCLVSRRQEVWCWGMNYAGQCGLETINGTLSVALRANEITDAIQVATGREHSCALLSDGQVLCWGSDNCGQLGRGTGGEGNCNRYSEPFENHPAPVAVGGL